MQATDSLATPSVVYNKEKPKYMRAVSKSAMSEVSYMSHNTTDFFELNDRALTLMDAPSGSEDISYSKKSIQMYDSNQCDAVISSPLQLIVQGNTSEV